MTHKEDTLILVIDDEPDELLDQIELELSDKVEAIVVHPRDVEVTQLEDADLVLVDYRLDKWSERDAQTISLRPATGLALAVLLREQVDRPPQNGSTAFALHTGHLDEIQGRLPSAIAEHVRARLNNLEWAFQKSETRRFDQMVILANAVRQLPSKWPTDPNDSTEVAKRLLEVRNIDELSERCWRDVRECRVPLHDVQEDRHGILFLRWLLHEVMPYPTFLWKEHWVAARLGICVDDLRIVLKGSSQLAEELKSLRYSGILAGFLGDRWWRSALEDYVWELAGEHNAEGKILHELLTERAERNLNPLDAKPAVVCLSGDFEPSGQFLSPIVAVTIHPDHWPAFADSAWMDIETVRDDPALFSLVDSLDQHVFSSDTD